MKLKREIPRIEPEKNAPIRENAGPGPSGLLKRKKVKDAFIKEKFPGAQIHTLLAREHRTRLERAVDELLCLFTPLMDVFPLVKGIKNLDNEFYLVACQNGQRLVRLTQREMEIWPLAAAVESKRFALGDYVFEDCGPVKG